MAFFPAINPFESFLSDDTLRCYDSHCIPVFINFEEGIKANSYYLLLLVTVRRWVEC